MTSVERREYLQRVEDYAAETGWLTPPTQENRDYMALLFGVCTRYNIVLSRATPLEFEFVTRVADDEFYARRAANI